MTTAATTTSAAVTQAQTRYRRLLVLYPQGFRRDYGDDLVQAFGDMVAFGADGRTGWWATLRDLVPSAAGEWRTAAARGMKSNKPSPIVLIAILVGLAAAVMAGPGPFVSLLAPLILIPSVVVIGLPLYGLSRLHQAWVNRRSTGSPVRRDVAVGVATFIPAGVILSLLGEDAGYFIFIAVALALIVGSGLGIIWGLVRLADARRDRGPSGKRPWLILVPSVLVLAVIIGASYNSYRNSLGPPGDHSVENASVDTRALWEAADAGNVTAVVRLTNETCADPWVKFPTGGDGKHNAKGQAEALLLEGAGVLGGRLEEIAALLGDYMDVWNDRCGQGAG